MVHVPTARNFSTPAVIEQVVAVADIKVTNRQS
jgi:hypothetical protein